MYTYKYMYNIHRYSHYMRPLWRGFSRMCACNQVPLLLHNAQIFSKVLSTVDSISECTRALTIENVCLPSAAAAAAPDHPLCPRHPEPAGCEIYVSIHIHVYTYTHLYIHTCARARARARAHSHMYHDITSICVICTNCCCAM